MLSPIHLQTLVTVVRVGSFADAARQLSYTSSAVSQQVSQLERALGLTLFEREAQRVRPTPAAEFLASRAQSTLAALGSLEEDLRDIAQGTAGRLRIGSFPTASERLIPAAIASYLPDHRAVEIVLDEDEPDRLVPRLQDGELDMALVYSYSDVPRRWPEGLAAVDLLHEELLLLLGKDHPCFGHTQIQMADMASATWISTANDSAGAACLRAVCEEAGFEPSIAFRSNDYDVIREFVASGLGVALVPHLSHPATQFHRAHHPIDLTARRHVQLLHRTPMANPALHGMILALKESARELVAASEGLAALPS